MRINLAVRMGLAVRMDRALRMDQTLPMDQPSDGSTDRSMVGSSLAVDRTKIRIGLGIISVIFIAALVLALVIDEPFGRAVLIGVALVCAVRMALLVRWMKQQRTAAS